MYLDLPPGPFEAYLFDCDGTIADSMPLHYRAWTEALAPRGCPFTEEDFYAWAGTPTPEIVRLLNRKYQLTLSVDEVADAKERNYFRLLPEISAVPAVRIHILNPPAGVKLAVVSGSPRESVANTLGFLKLSEFFPVVVGAEDCTRGKPAPDPFLLAAERLGVHPSRCLVFEDAELGIESARAAGMQWVKVDPRQLKRDTHS